MHRFRTHEKLIGFLLAAAMFATVSCIKQPIGYFRDQTSAAKSSRADKKEEQHRPLWEWLSRDASGFFTAWLALIGLGQAGLFFWQLHYMRQGMGDARDAADAAKVAAEAGKAQVAALMASERPFIFFEVTKNGIEHCESGFNALAPHFAYVLTNCGKTPAILLELKEEAIVFDGVTDAPPALNPIDDKDRGILLPIGTVIPANGVYRELGYDIERRAVGFQKLAMPNSWLHSRLFFRGFLRFKDTFGNYYVTGFQMIFSPQHNAWALRGGDDANYCRQENPSDIPPHPRYPGVSI